MNKPKEEHYATFYSPGTLFSETTTLPISAWDPKEAITLGDGIVERRGARPYAFRFETRLMADPIPDGRGGTMDVTPKSVASSGQYFLGGALTTLDEAIAARKPDERVMRDNMRCNRIPIIVTTVRGYRSTQPFSEDSVIVDAGGNIVERGDDPKHVAYRAECIARIEAGHH